MRIRPVPLLLTVLLTLALPTLAACGGDEEPPDDAASGSVAPDTPAAERPPDASSVSLDEYILAVCGDGLVSEWEEGESLKDLSSGLAFVSEQMGSIAPPVEVAEWHDAQLAFAGAFKETIDDFLDDPGGRTEDEFLLSMFVTVLPHFEPVEEAIAGMDRDVRARMAEAGCIDSEAAGPVTAAPERAEIPIGGSADGEIEEPYGIAYLTFRADMGQRYVIEVTYEGFPQLFLVIKDPPDAVVKNISTRHSEESPLVTRWTANESGPFGLDAGFYEGTGSFTVSVSIDATPVSPEGVTATREGSAITVSWEPVDGAERYIVYHDDWGPGCKLREDGTPAFCRELASDVMGTSYTHTTPDDDGNYYWVVACNSEGCSRIYPNEPITP